MSQKIITFRDLNVWKKAHELTLLIYKETKSFPSEEKFGLISQIRRAAVSVASNLVEGFRRKSLKDSLNFYNMADSSLEELKYQLLLSLDLHFINNNKYQEIENLAEQTGKMLYRWIQWQKRKLS